MPSRTRARHYLLLSILNINTKAHSHNPGDQVTRGCVFTQDSGVSLTRALTARARGWSPAPAPAECVSSDCSCLQHSALSSSRPWLHVAAVSLQTLCSRCSDTVSAHSGHSDQSVHSDQGLLTNIGINLLGS